MNPRLTLLAADRINPDIELPGGDCLVGLLQQALPAGANGLRIDLSEPDPPILNRIGPGRPRSSSLQGV